MTTIDYSANLWTDIGEPDAGQPYIVSWIDSISATSTRDAAVRALEKIRGQGLGHIFQVRRTPTDRLDYIDLNHWESPQPAAPVTTTKYTVVTGNPTDGFTLNGVFDSQSDALAYANDNGGTWVDHWWIMRIHPLPAVPEPLALIREDDEPDSDEEEEEEEQDNIRTDTPF
jgi:hypothetical protein